MQDRQRSNIVFAIVAVLILAAGGYGYFWLENRKASLEPAEPLQQEPVAPVAEVADKAPRYPVTKPQDAPPPATTESQQALPTLDESDAPVLAEIAAVTGDPALVESSLVRDSLIRNFVITIDNLPRSELAERVRPWRRPSGSFQVETGRGESGAAISAKNFARYDTLAATLGALDVERAVAAYRYYYPLLQAVFEDIGYPDDYFNDRLVEVIDHLLETPEVEGPVTLKRPNVLYEYADPQLESRSSGQKMLLRMGTQNAARVKRTLRTLRAEIVPAADNAGRPRS